MVKKPLWWVRVLLVISLVCSNYLPFAAYGQGDSPTSPAPSDIDGQFIQVTADQLSSLPELGTPAPASNAPATFDELVQRVQQLQPLLQELGTSLDRSQFDIAELGASLDYDAAAIVDFVHREIAFEQYPGVLRGEFGTLIGRAGNAADQALLLRRLLDDAGYQTRLVRGRLSPTQAESLVNQMAAPRPVEPPPIDDATLDRITVQIAQVTGVPLQDLMDPTQGTSEQFYQVATESDTQLIFRALEAANIPLGDDQQIDKLVEEARDYIWVQYRISPFDPWVDAHSAFSDPSAAPEAMSVEHIYRDTLPDDLYHRLRLEMSIEQKVGDELVVHPILTGWERPAAELVGKPITITNQPNNLDLQTAADIDTMLANANLILPVINGELGDKGFDLHGNPFGTLLAAPGVIGATALVSSAAEVLGNASEALNSLGEVPDTVPEESISLTAEWIDYILIAPDGSETTTRRYIMDRIGTANRERGISTIPEGSDIIEDSKALLTEHTILVIPTRYSSAYSADRLLASYQKMAELLAYVHDNPDISAPPQQFMEEMVPNDDVAYDLALSITDSDGENLVSYLPAPILMVYQSGIVPGREEDTGFERVDIIHNPRRVFQAVDDVIQPAPMETIRQGVWETYAERTLIRGSSLPAFNTFSALREAADASIPLVVLRQADADNVSSLQQNTQTRDDVLRDLEAGYVVIIPERAPNGSGSTGWWRIDPRTGETLGITTGGYGQQYVEYLIVMYLASMTALKNTNDCMKAGGAKGCCIGHGMIIGLTVGIIGAFAPGASTASEKALIALAGYGFSDVLPMVRGPKFSC